MKKIIISILIIISVSGCWNYKELNEYSIVTGIAVDKIKDNYEFSVLISSASKNKGNNESSKTQTVVYTGKGRTMFEALKDIGLISPKELYLGNFSVLVLSEKVAKEGIKNTIDLFLRESSIKKNFFVTIAKDCKAKDTLEIITPLSDFPSQNISDNLMSTSHLQGIISNINFNDLLSKIVKPGIDPVINSVELFGNEKIGSTNKNAETSEPKAYTKLGVLGIFKKDKLVAWANKEESIGINILNNKVTEMFFNINYKNNNVVINTSTLQTNTTVKLINNKPTIIIDLIGEGKIVEVNGKINLNDNKVMKELKNMANKKIKDYITKGIDISKESKADIFGFGLKFIQNYPNYYKHNKNNWFEIINKAKFKITSDLVIKTKGSSKNSLEEIIDEKQNI